MIHAAGHVPRWGTRADLDPDSTLMVDLEAGWGVEFLLHDEAFQPVSGVRLLLDGNPTDPSDEQGRLRAVRAKRPTQVTVDAPGWSLGTKAAVDLLDQLFDIPLFLRRLD